MAGRIRAEDITTVKERASIEDVVRDHVTLRSAGVGSLKGLCPFHDEKTPSFTIRPAVGTYHCFGCGESGDVLDFVQKVDHLTFTDAVERLAAKVGMELRYEEGGGPREPGTSLGKRSRLVEAHRVAEEFYTAMLLDRARGDARTGRDFLRERGFDSAAVERFGVGFAPADGDALTRHLLSRGFPDDELTTAGLSGRGRGLYDRFRGRLVWPIRDITGDTVGFGARRLFDEDRIQAKYLNTSETPIYKKTTVLYGLDLAKKAIRDRRRAVVVEGYTDVMAAHLAGVEEAVASCGTAFGVDHIKVLRRIVRDEADQSPARVVFTFDGDKAGQDAAMKAFREDQRWAAQSFVAVAPDGMDPCELRLAKGDAEVRALVDGATPLFEFAVRTTIRRFDLETAEGRVQAMKAVAPIIGSIRDTSLRPEYIRTVSGWLGVEVEQLAAQVRTAGSLPAPEDRSPDRSPAGTDDVPEPGPGDGPVLPAPDLRDPVVARERQLLQAVVQYPQQFSDATLDALHPGSLAAPAHGAVLDGVRIAAASGHRTGSTAGWVAAVSEAVAVSVKPLVAELSVAPLPVRYDPTTGLPPRHYLDSLVLGVRDAELGRRISDAMASLRRAQNDPDAPQESLRERTTALHALELERVRLRQEAMT